MSSHLVFCPKERMVPSLRRGYRTPDPSPSRDAANLPGCVMNLFIAAQEELEQERGRARVAIFSRTPSPSPTARHDQKAPVNDTWENTNKGCSTKDWMPEKPFNQKLQLKFDELALPDNNLSEISTPRERARAKSSLWADDVVDPTMCQDNLSNLPGAQVQEVGSKWSRERTPSPTPSWCGALAPSVLPLSTCIVYTQQQQQPTYQQSHHIPVQMELAKTCLSTSPAIQAVPAPPVPPRNSQRNRDCANASQNPSRYVSRGSIGHPHQCASSCKYAWKKRGCKDGINCDRCHLCEWKRYSGHAS